MTQKLVLGGQYWPSRLSHWWPCLWCHLWVYKAAAAANGHQCERTSCPENISNLFPDNMKLLVVGELSATYASQTVSNYIIVRTREASGLYCTPLHSSPLSLSHYVPQYWILSYSFNLSFISLFSQPQFLREVLPGWSVSVRSQICFTRFRQGV